MTGPEGDALAATESGDDPLSRYLPLGLGGASTLGATLVDVNYGAIAGGITLIFTALAAGYWNLASNRTRARKDADLAHLQIARQAEADKLEVYRASETAKLEVFRAAELARIDLQKTQDTTNQGSLSAQLVIVGAQLAAIQQSLSDAREVNSGLKAQLSHANARLKSLEAKHVIRAEEARSLSDRIDQVVDGQAAQLSATIPVTNFAPDHEARPAIQTEADAP